MRRLFGSDPVRGRRTVRASALLVCAAAALVCALLPAAQAHLRSILKLAPLNVIIVGGGPTPDHNQVAIESNVRYVTRLLPAESHRSTLFADGDLNNASVLYVEDVKSMPADQEAFALAMEGNDRDFSAYGHYRKPSIPGTLDGASSKQNVGNLIDRVGQDPKSAGSPLLLYFTGHGSPLSGNLENNHYDLWGRSATLSVHELADQVSRLPAAVPVTVVMAQCYSGAFGNLLFEGGDPANPYTTRDIVGFYATTKERVAAGCTPALNEAEYHDFTSYFFAALTGQDRMGRKVSGADYNRDGHVGMDEAFCYTLVHDESIDVPVCTTDVLLRHDVPFKIEEMQQTPFADIKRWATRPQRAALDGLSARLQLTSDERYAEAIKMITPRPDPQAQQNQRQTSQVFRQQRSERRAFLFGRWPDIKRPGTPGYTAARTEALAQIGAEIKAGGAWKQLIDAYDAEQSADDTAQVSENNAAAALRFVRVCTSVCLAHRLMQVGTPEQKSRFNRLAAAERRPLLEPTHLSGEGDDQPADSVSLR